MKIKFSVEMKENFVDLLDTLKEVSFNYQEAFWSSEKDEGYFLGTIDTETEWMKLIRIGELIEKKRITFLDYERIID